MRFSKVLVHFRYSGQAPTCRHCHQTGHLANACHTIICYNCEQISDLASACIHPLLCNIRKSSEHRAWNCPLTWLCEINEVQHAIDQQQRQNDLALPPTETNFTQASTEISDPANDTEMTDQSHADLFQPEHPQMEASENPSEFLSDEDEDPSEMEEGEENTPQLFDNSTPSPPATQLAPRRKPGKISDTSVLLHVPTRPVLVSGCSLSADDRLNSQTHELSDTENSEPPAKRKPNGQRTVKFRFLFLFLSLLLLCDFAGRIPPFL